MASPGMPLQMAGSNPQMDPFIELADAPLDGQVDQWMSSGFFQVAFDARGTTWIAVNAN